MDKHQPHLTDGYGQLLQRLRKDLQLDATTDLLPGSIAAAVSADTATNRLTWTTPSLINAWANAGIGFENAGYLKDPLGIVHLRGTVTGGVNNSVAFVLPAGYRPAFVTNNSVPAGSGGAAELRVDTSGNVTIFYSGAVTTIGLSGITFLAEN